MNIKIIHRYCDRILKEMAKQPDSVKFRFAIGVYKNEELKNEDDLFTKLKIPDNYHIYILDIFRETKYVIISLIKTGATQDANLKIIDNGGRLYLLMLVKEGRLFIGSTSFRKLDRDEWLQKWVGHWLSFLAIIIAITSAVITYTSLIVQKTEKEEILKETDKKLKDYDKKINVRLDSLKRHH